MGNKRIEGGGDEYKRYSGHMQCNDGPRREGETNARANPRRAPDRIVVGLGSDFVETLSGLLVNLGSGSGERPARNGQKTHSLARNMVQYPEITKPLVQEGPGKRGQGRPWMSGTQRQQR